VPSPRSTPGEPRRRPDLRPGHRQHRRRAAHPRRAGLVLHPAGGSRQRDNEKRDLARTSPAHRASRSAFGGGGVDERFGGCSRVQQGGGVVEGRRERSGTLAASCWTSPGLPEFRARSPPSLKTGPGRVQLPPHAAKEGRRVRGGGMRLTGSLWSVPRGARRHRGGRGLVGVWAGLYCYAARRYRAARYPPAALEGSLCGAPARIGSEPRYRRGPRRTARCLRRGQGTVSFSPAVTGSRAARTPLCGRGYRPTASCTLR
jgi:hypothetical protein